MPRSAIVVGAGLAGLTAAHRLHQAGWDVEVLEAAGEVGGRAVSVAKQGYLFDSGAVGVGTVYQDYMALVNELGLADRVVNTSSISATVRGGRLREIDSKNALSGLTTDLLSFGSKLKLINLFMDLGRVKRSGLDIRDVAGSAAFDDESIEAYARRRLNPEILEYFIEPLARTVNLNRARNVSKLEVMNSLAGLFDTTMITLTGGLATFAQALARPLDVKLHTRVEAVQRVGERVDVRATAADGSRFARSADVCVLATTLTRALDLYPDARAQYAPLTAVLRYNRGLCVHLGYRAATRTKALIAMMPPSEHPEIALFFLEHNKGPDRAPKGGSMITAFFDETAIDRPWGQADDGLARETAATVERILPELAGHLEMRHVTRWPEGLTNPAPGIYRAMQAVNRARDPKSRVQLTGDYHSTAGQNSAVAWGNNTARSLVETFR
ncbi:MAG TPA: FAD-dependent oxidoreductase [Nevskiaceae bacterium]|nr:FAD-dependent oxidoreductase [Nevskiaceae bacterium]